MNYLVLLSIDRLSKSRFRTSQKLSKKLRDQAIEKGDAKLRKNAYDILSKRLFIANPKNDGKQTPFKGHPVFVAQHATGTCCRSCLEKWHSIPRGIEINEEWQQFVIELVIHWINSQIKYTGNN